MHPVLFHFGRFTLYTYGFFVAVGVISGIFFARHEARRIGVDPEKIMDLCFYVIIAAIIGSRLFYVATAWKFFLAHPVNIFKIWNGGLVFYGGFLGALITAIILVKAYRLPLGKTADIAGISIPLGHFFGRLGCFSAGCCYGRECHLPFAVTFHNPSSLAPLNVPLYPTQLFSAAANLSIFLVLFFLRRRKRFDGQLFWLYVLLYGILRSVIEVYRGDFRGAEVFGVLSISQTIGLGFAVLAALMLFYLFRKSRRASS